MKKIAEIKNLSLAFRTPDGTAEVIRDISFDIRTGECVALVGESGCGKTTVAKAVMGLHKDKETIVKPNSRIEFDGKNILEFSKNEWQEFRGKQAAMIFQDAMSSLNPTMRIGEQIAEAIFLHQKISRKEALHMGIKLLGQMGVADPEENIRRYPFEFSGGMRQRVMIAMAMACNPQLLIGDEPTTALDVTIQTQILQLIKELQTERGMAVLLVTHNFGIVAGMAQRVVVMYNGKIVEKGKTEEIFYHPMHPYTQALLKSTLRMDTKKDRKELYCIEGTPPGIIAPPGGCPFAKRCAMVKPVCWKSFPIEHKETDTQIVYCWQYKKED